MEAHEEIVRDFSAAVRQLGAADLAKWPANRRLEAMQMLVSYSSPSCCELASVGLMCHHALSSPALC